MSAPVTRVRRRYGDEAIATPANLVTIARLLLAVPTLLLIVDAGLDAGSRSALWFVLTTTDGLDGWLARRDGTTRSGAFLDPLADKFLVLGGFFALGITGDFSWAAVAIVTVREVGVSHVPLVRGQARHLAARPAGSGSGRRSSSSSRSASCCCRRRTSGRRSTTSCCGSRSPVGGLGPRHRDQRPARVAAAVRAAKEGSACGVTSSRSAPSCCSARSSTPTARGSASSSPRPGSTPASTARWATTSSAWCSACASCSTAPTRSSCAAASGPRPTTSPARRSPR